MLPSLILRCAMTGSRRVSNDDAPPLLVGGFPLATKLLTAAFRLYSSSTARFLRWRKYKKPPPAAAAITTIPTTTPAAMAALFVPPPDDLLDPPADELAGAVTTMVCPPTVTTEFPAVDVDEGVLPAEDVADECEPVAVA